MASNASARRTNHTSRLLALAVGAAAVLASVAFGVAPANAAQAQGIKPDGQIVPVALNSAQSNAMIVSHEVMKEGVYFREFTTGGVVVKPLYSSPYSQDVTVTAELQELASDGVTWQPVDTSLDVTGKASLGDGQYAELGSATFDLPYKYTNESDSFRVVYDAVWDSPDPSITGGDHLGQMSITSQGNSAVCFDRVLTCTADHGIITD